MPHTFRKGLLKDACKAPYPRKGCLKKLGRPKAIGRGSLHDARRPRFRKRTSAPPFSRCPRQPKLPNVSKKGSRKPGSRERQSTLPFSREGSPPASTPKSRQNGPRRLRFRERKSTPPFSRKEPRQPTQPKVVEMVSQATISRAKDRSGLTFFS